MRRKFAVMVFLVIIFIFSGCDKNHQVSTPNFNKALNKHLAETPAVFLWQTKYPAYYLNTTEIGDGLCFQAENSYIRALVAAGLVTHIGDTVVVKDTSHNLHYQIYDLTDFGYKVALNPQRDSLRNRVSIKGFVFATQQVDKIIRYTEPADRDGRKISEVTYTIGVSDVARWAKDIVKVLKSVADMNDFCRDRYIGQTFVSAFPQGKHKMELIQTSDGWIPKEELNKSYVSNNFFEGNLILQPGEAWSRRRINQWQGAIPYGIIFEKNGDLVYLDHFNGYWQIEKKEKWAIKEGKLLINSQERYYRVTDNTLTLGGAQYLRVQLSQ